MPSTAHLRFDTRLLRRNLRDGKLSKEDYQERLDSLEDLSDRFDLVEIMVEEDLADRQKPAIANDATEVQA